MSKPYLIATVVAFGNGGRSHYRADIRGDSAEIAVWENGPVGRELGHARIVNGRLVGVDLDATVLGRLEWRLRAAQEALPCPWCGELGPHSVGGHHREGVIVPTCDACNAVASLPPSVGCDRGARPAQACLSCAQPLDHASGLLVGTKVYARCLCCGEVHDDMRPR